MFADSKNLEILEKYFAGQLTKEEQALLDASMKTDPNFKELAAYFEDFMIGMEDFGDKQVMLQLQTLEQTIQQEELQEASQNQGEGILQQLLDKANYTLDQLASLFRPIPTYQALLTQAHRGNNIPLKKSNEEWDLAVSAIELKFSKPTSIDLSLTIENNQRENNWTATVPQNSTIFSVQMEDTQINKPGRYYLKISNGQETILKEFFVHKDWMG